MGFLKKLLLLLAFSSSLQADVFFKGEFLYWKASQEGLDYAVFSKAPITFPPLLDGEVKELDFGYDPGFRVEGGVFLPASRWDITLNWTCFHTSTSKHNEIDNVGFLSPTQITPFVNFQAAPSLVASAASARWKVEYDAIALEMGRTFALVKYILLRPHFGLIGARIDQKMEFDYLLFDALPGVYAVRNRNDFKGIGLRSGLDLFCPLGKGWNIYSQFATALLSSWFQVDQHETGTDGPFAIKSKEKDIVGHFQIAAGILWKQKIGKRIRIDYFIGYEFNEWFRQNRLIAFNQGQNFGSISRNPGDLEFQGLRAGLGLNF